MNMVQSEDFRLKLTLEGVAMKDVIIWTVGLILVLVLCGAALVGAAILDYRNNPTT
jgi:hypothetical protein